MCVQIWLLEWEAGEREVWLCKTSFPGSPIPVLLKSTHEAFCSFFGWLLFMEQKIHWAEMNWTTAPLWMNDVSFGSFWWNCTSQALAWKQQRRFLKLIKRKDFSYHFKGWRQKRHDKATINTFSQNPLPMRSWWCYEIEGKRPFQLDLQCFTDATCS